MATEIQQIEAFLVSIHDDVNPERAQELGKAGFHLANGLIQNGEFKNALIGFQMVEASLGHNMAIAAAFAMGYQAGQFTTQAVATESVN